MAVRPAASLQGAQAALGDLGEVDGLAVQLDLAGGDAGDVQQVVEEPRQVPALAGDDPAEAFLLAARVRLQGVGGGADRLPGDCAARG